MDMIEEVQALVSERSLGEIKLSTTETIVFTTGSVAATRLTADKIKKQFALKTEAERAVPNAILHTLLDKVPGSTERLQLKEAVLTAEEQALEVQEEMEQLQAADARARARAHTRTRARVRKRKRKCRRKRKRKRPHAWRGPRVAGGGGRGAAGARAGQA